MKVEVIKFDNMGRGIGYIDNKIIFIPKSAPGDIIEVEIIKNKKDYLEGKIINIIKPSRIRKEIKCPYYNSCGGCDLLHISLTEEMEYKLLKVNDILKKNNINYDVKEIIKCDNEYNYRNKITLKIVNKEIGYYISETHNLLPIDNCLLVNEDVNNLIKDLHHFNLVNGEIIIRSNYKNELLIIINSNDEIKNIEYIITNHNIVGIIQNNKCIYGENFLIQKINDYLFKVSYNAFFQVNINICEKLFKLIDEYTKNSKNILDLYCGVGTLSIVVSHDKENVVGVEIVENAIKDANINKNLNKINNISFICSDTKNILDKIIPSFDTIILDPPRSGVDEKVLKKILNTNIKQIIYISCNPFTLVRDLKLLLNNYQIQTLKLLDMFTWSEHVESFCVLKLK